MLFRSRSVAESTELPPPLLGAPLADLTLELRRRIAADGTAITRARQQQLRDEVLRDAGGTNYDRIEDEFRALAAGLRWPRQSTLKDFRHLFLTALSNAGIGDAYRQYFAGQALSGAPVTRYTHLNQLREQFERALQREFPSLLNALVRRLRELAA